MTKANGYFKIIVLRRKKWSKIYQQIKVITHPQKFSHEGKNIISQMVEMIKINFIFFFMTDKIVVLEYIIS